jgi:hypothetical protein
MAGDPQRRYQEAARRSNHNRIAMELATFAELAGNVIEFEPSHGQGKLSDLLVSGGSLAAPFAIEVTQFGFTQDLAESSAATEVLKRMLIDVEEVPGVHVSFKLGGVPSADEFGAWIRTVIEAARSGTRGTVPGPMGGYAEIGSRTEDHPGAWRLAGPTSGGDEWGRMALRIKKKAQQCAGGLPTWLHFTHDGFLFVGNTWMNNDHLVRLTQLEGNAMPLLDGAPELSGLVLTTRIGAYQPSGTSRAERSVRHMEPATAREVYIIPASGTDDSDVDWWLSLYAVQEPRFWKSLAT